MVPFTSIALMTAAFALPPSPNRSVLSEMLAPRARTEYVIDRRDASRANSATWNEPVYLELLSYKTFVDGWDGEGSRAPASGDIDAALSFIEMLKPHMDIPKAMVSSDGQIGLYWDRPFIYIDLNFESNGTISIYSRDRSTVPNRETFTDNINPRKIASLLAISEILDPQLLVP